MDNCPVCHGEKTRVVDHGDRYNPPQFEDCPACLGDVVSRVGLVQEALESKGGAMTIGAFAFEVVTECVLSVDEIWPDGDAPTNPTVADVRRVIEECGGDRRVIRDWNLTPEYIIVTAVGEGR